MEVVCFPLGRISVAKIFKLHSPEGILNCKRGSVFVMYSDRLHCTWR